MASDSLPLVTYILAAEFDIDKGSGMKYMYPTKPDCAEEAYLAEMMLPDGAHKRLEDWTVFFINRPGLVAQPKDKKSASKNKPAAPVNHPKAEAYIYEYREETEKWEMMGNEKKVLVFQPDKILVTTKEGENITFIGYHEDLEYSQLEPLFSCALNSDGNALGFRFGSEAHEKLMHDHVEYLLKNKPALSKENPTPAVEEKASAPEPDKPKKMLYCINRVLTVHDESLRRGGLVRAIAFCSPHPYIHILKPLLILALDHYMKNPTEETLKKVYEAVNSIPPSQIPTLSYRQKLFLRGGAENNPDKEFPGTIEYGGAKLKIKFPLYKFPDEVGDFAVTTLVKKFNLGIMQIFNCLLFQKRILFLGATTAAGSASPSPSSEEVCSCVLATISLISPPLPDVAYRAFPLTNLTAMDFLTVEGYVAGVCNPVFEGRHEWWDLLCDVSTGVITRSTKSNLLPPEQEKYYQWDCDFFNKKISHNVAGHFGETQLKALFQDYAQHILDIATEEEEFPNESTKKAETEANKQRTDAIKKTSSFALYQAEVAKRAAASSIKSAAIPRNIRKLRNRKKYTRCRDDGDLRVFRL